MKVLSFKATAIEYYKRAQRDQSLCKKKIKDGQWVRGHIARIDQCYGIHIVYMTVEEFEGGLDAERLPPGFYLGPLPAVTIGDPSNQRMEFVVSEDAIRYYPVGRAIRVDSRMDNVGKLEGMIVKTCREPNALKPYWRVTVELPAPELRFEHYAIRSGHTVHLNYESGCADYHSQGQNTYIKPSLKSIRFKVESRYMPGFQALFARNKKVCVRLEDSSADVSGFVSWLRPEEGQVEVQVAEVNQQRPATARESYSRRLLEQMSKSLGVPYDILTADDTKLSVGPLAKEYATFHQCDEYMADILKQKEQTMKIFDAVVVKVDEKGTPTEIAKVVPPFLAKDEASAKTAIMVDYATENKIAGKDLTGISVLVRPFQVGY